MYKFSECCSNHKFNLNIDRRGREDAQHPCQKGARVAYAAKEEDRDGVRANAAATRVG